MKAHDEGEVYHECGKRVTVSESYLYGGKVHCEDCFNKKIHKKNEEK